MKNDVSVHKINIIITQIAILYLIQIAYSDFQPEKRAMSNVVKVVSKECQNAVSGTFHRDCQNAVSADSLSKCCQNCQDN